MDLTFAPDLNRRVSFLVAKLDLKYIRAGNIVCFRSQGATSRARARIWSLPKIWQMALGVEAHYCLEVLAQYFDHMSPDDQERTLIHELMHIPKNFSGALVPHRTHAHRTFRHYHDTVETLFRSLETKSYQI
ncbi:MAG: putative metallopeptidase [bacterium]|nr:putative metallopeptidase [bacterium]